MSNQRNSIKTTCVLILASLACLLASCGKGEEYSPPRPRTTMITERLHIAPCQESDIDDYYNHIYGSAEVAKTFLVPTGKPMKRSQVIRYVLRKVNRWEQGEHFSAFTVRDKATNKFLGTMGLGSTDEKNSAWISYAIRQEEWNKRYGSEAVKALMEYARRLYQAGYKLDYGQPFERVITVVRKDNKPSVKILKKVGFKVYKAYDEFYDQNIFDHYEYDMSQTGQ